MANVVVVGAQWGDEGKGKIVDWLSVSADVIVRFQGGHNAGHTLVIGGKVFKLALLPSGIVRPGKLSVIGNGVVLDPYHLAREIEAVRAQGVEVSPDNLKVAENVPLILSFYRDLDAHRESGDAGAHGIGTTQARHRPGLRGQGRPARDPADGPRRPRLARRQDRPPARPSYAAVARHGADAAATPRRCGRNCWRSRRRCCPTWRRRSTCSTASAAPASASCSRARRGRCSTSTTAPIRIVTSSNTVAANAATGSGLGPRAIGYVLGIAKAYTTRVGGGPFPTELTDEIGARLGRIGKEFGTNTGRPRRCGWFDAALTRQTVKTSGIDGVALTKLDVLDGFDEIKVCTHYTLDGERIDYMPANPAAQARLAPVYETHAGLARRDQRRALLGRPAGAGDQIRSAHRGIDRGAGCVTIDESRARRHDSGA